MYTYNIDVMFIMTFTFYLSVINQLGDLANLSKIVKKPVSGNL